MTLLISLGVRASAVSRCTDVLRWHTRFCPCAKRPRQLRPLRLSTDQTHLYNDTMCIEDVVRARVRTAGLATVSRELGVIRQTVASWLAGSGRPGTRALLEQKATRVYAADSAVTHKHTGTDQ